MEDVAIIGAGPAGAHMGYLLAKNGVEVAVYDPSHPREKPCGGGLTPLALEKYPFLWKTPGETRKIKGTKVISPRGTEAFVQNSAVNVSRKDLDGYLLEKAVRAGATHRKEHLKSLEYRSGRWVLETTEQKTEARIVIGADGAKSKVREKTLGPIENKNLAVATGYYIRGIEEDYNTVKFLPNIRGYIWSFPRKNHASVGIGVPAGQGIKAIEKLDSFIRERYPENMEKNRWGAVVPQIKDPGFYRASCAGKNWSLIGDAAGHVDPVKEEGITYALWSAELAAKAYLEGDLTGYDPAWRREYGKDFVWGVRLARILYHPRFLEYALKKIEKNRAYAQLLGDIIAGRQGYKNLAGKMIKGLPGILLGI